MKRIIEYTCNPALFPPAGDIFCSTQFTVDECIELSDYKPNMLKIIDVKTTPELESHKLINSPTGKKVFIKGHLEQEILYTVDSLCQPVHVLLNCVPFCTFIALKDCCTYEYEKLEAYQPKILVEYMQTEQVGCRSIRKCVILFIWYPRAIFMPPRPIQPYPCRPQTPYRPAGKGCRLSNIQRSCMTIKSGSMSSRNF